VWRIFVLLVLFTLATVARGQDLSRRPELLRGNDSSFPDKPHTLSVETILAHNPNPARYGLGSPGKRVAR
jgi:hypothetical protein